MSTQQRRVLRISNSTITTQDLETSLRVEAHEILREGPKTIFTGRQQIKIADLLTPQTVYRLDAPLIAFHVWCREEDREEAREVLRDRLKSHLLKLTQQAELQIAAWKAALALLAEAEA